GLGQRARHAGEVPALPGVGFVRGVPDPVIGDPVLREVVRADPLGPVDRPYLRLTGVGRGRGRLLLGELGELGPEHAHGPVLVLQLRTLVLAGHHDPGWQVGDAYRRVGGVDALPTRAAGAEHVDPEVIDIDGDLGLLRLRSHQYARRRGVDPALRLGRRYPLHPVYATLPLQPRPDPVPALRYPPGLDRHRDVLVP